MRASRSSGHPRAFTLVEALVVIAIVITLALIGIAAGLGVARTGRAAAERQLARSITMAISQFETEFGILPPLIDDDSVIQNDQPNLIDDDDLDDADSGNYSVNTIPYYLMGLADFDIGNDKPFDGKLGPRMSRVRADGSFARKGRPIEAFIEAPNDERRLARRGRDEFALLDFWGVQARQMFGENPDDNPVQRPKSAIRYYRWEPTFENGRIESQDDLNIPAALGGGANAAALRGAKYAVVSLGPDREMGTEDDIVETGQ